MKQLYGMHVEFFIIDFLGDILCIEVEGVLLVPRL